jgi:hypothetical protein
MGDIKLDEGRVAEMLMDENTVASLLRPGTSLNVHDRYIKQEWDL